MNTFGAVSLVFVMSHLPSRNSGCVTSTRHTRYSLENSIHACNNQRERVKLYKTESTPKAIVCPSHLFFYGAGEWVLMFFPAYFGGGVTVGIQ